jgi:hypothetical protein
MEEKVYGYADNLRFDGRAGQGRSIFVIDGAFDMRQNTDLA